MDSDRYALCPAVRFDRISVRFGQTNILENVCATVPQGGATALIGPTGAGKTTLLHCLVGTVSYNGAVVDTRPRIGYVPQQMRLDDGMPLLVGEFVSMHVHRRPLWLGRSAYARKRARDLLGMTGAGRLEAGRMGELSGGELRRVLLAAALACDPELLLLDEPAAGVDVSGERRFWEMLDAVRRQRKLTQLVVSHNLPLVARYATHVICLNKRLVAEGAPRSTLTSSTLMRLFGIPIHLYPDQCDSVEPPCPEYGAPEGESSHV